MKKIKYQGTLTKYITSSIANKNRKIFERLTTNYLKHLLTNWIKDSNKKVALEVVSFSSSNDFCEQILSILSFIKYVGYPTLWTVYSDGSHSKTQIEILKTSFSFITVNDIKWWDSNKLPVESKDKLIPFEEFFLDYGKKHPLGKKLFNYLNHKIANPCLFIDSDILFYNKSELLDIALNDETIFGWFLPDAEWGCLDSRFKKDNENRMYQINSGFFLLRKEIENLNSGLDFFKNMAKEYEYFSEQTIFHILFSENNFMPLDPRYFVLDSKDQFDFSYKFYPKDIAVRHYTGPVRHKMWQKNYKWHLSLK